MRLAILADIHGNLPAFEAALKHAAQQKVDQMVIAGDVINGSPDSADCWRLAQSLGCPILRGNHERYAADYGTPKAAPVWKTELFAPLHWALDQLGDDERQAMGALPLSLRLPDAPDLFLVHATARDDHDTLSPHTPEELLNAMFPNVPERFIIRGHNHNAMVRLWKDGWIVTCGSVGLPLDCNPTAQYLLVDQVKNGWHVQHQSVPYNVQATIQRFYDTGYLAAAGPVARLYLREVLTASYYMVPFLRLYEQWLKEEPLPLAQAVERFLTSF